MGGQFPRVIDFEYVIQFVSMNHIKFDTHKMMNETWNR